MENKSFDIVVKRVGSFLEGKGFKKVNDKNSAVFTGQNGSIKLFFDQTKKRIELFVSNDLDVHEKTDWNLSSSWLFNPEVDGEKEAISIANDFMELLNEGAKKKLSKKRTKKDEDANVDPHFFINRLITLFPEIKNDADSERSQHKSFRYVHFIKSFVLSQVDILLTGNDSVKIKRFCKLLSESYENGDKDIRSIITIIILNSIEEEKSVEKVNALITTDLQKAWVAAKKFKGKKVKPEKIKTKKSFMSKLMDQNQK